MREVVTRGTGTGLRSVPGGPVYGKTGTAEFGDDTPPQTHAWFTGYQGDVAFAVIVEDGGFGAKAAVPILIDALTDKDPPISFSAERSLQKIGKAAVPGLTAKLNDEKLQLHAARRAECRDAGRRSGRPARCDRSSL